MLAPLYSLLAFGLLMLAAFGLGRPILRGLAVGQDDRLSIAVWSLALGLIAAGHGLATLGAIGLLHVPLIGLLTLAAAGCGLRELMRDHGSCLPQSVAPEDDSAWAPPSDWFYRVLLVAAGSACVGSLVGALAPPIAGDALCYHLELPKSFLAEHRLAFLPYHDNSTFPLLTEMLYLWGLALDGGVCAQLVHWAVGVLLMLATVLLAAPLLGRPWAWAAGTVVVLTPGLNNQMTAPLSDVALTLWTTLALAAWWRATVNDEGRRWLLLAGLMAGAALGTKYTALVFAAAVSVTWLWALARQPSQRRLFLHGAIVVSILATSVGGMWYLRAAWHRGNPVYPLLGEVFSRGNVEGDRPTCVDTKIAPTLPAEKSPLGRSPWAVATAPWELTMHPERFGGRGHQLGVLLLAVLPGLALSRRLRGLGTLLAVAGVYFVLWSLLRQNVRFLFPIVPLLAVAAVWVWIEGGRMPPWPRWLTTATMGAVVAAMAAVPLYRAREALAVAVGLEDRDRYLSRQVPTYQAAAITNRLFSPDSHMLSQDFRAFYFNCRVTRENVFRRQTHYDHQITDPATLSRHLRSAGFTHLLLAEAQGGDGIGYDPTLWRLADAQLASPGADELLTVTEYERQDPEGAVRRYRLVMLR